MDTTTGTVTGAAVAPLPLGSTLALAQPALVKYINAGQLLNVNGTLYFTAENNTHGNELWRSNSTAAGTTLVKDLVPGGNARPSGLVDAGGTFYFAAPPHRPGQPRDPVRETVGSSHWSLVSTQQMTHAY